MGPHKPRGFEGRAEALGASNPLADSAHLNCRTRAQVVNIVVKTPPPSRVAVLLPHEIVVIYVVLAVVLNSNPSRPREFLSHFARTIALETVLFLFYFYPRARDELFLAQQVVLVVVLALFF